MTVDLGFVMEMLTSTQIDVDNEPFLFCGFGRICASRYLAQFSCGLDAVTRGNRSVVQNAAEYIRRSSEMVLRTFLCGGAAKNSAFTLTSNPIKQLRVVHQRCPVCISQRPFGFNVGV
jgi:hypothetical protein